MPMASLTNTKEGDTLIVSSGSFRSPTIETVTRTTPTRVYCGSIAFTRAGNEYVRGWTGRFARPSTPEEIAEIHEDEKRDKCIFDIQVAVNTKALQAKPTSQLLAILAVIQETPCPK